MAMTTSPVAALQRRRQRRLVSEVARQPDSDDARVGRGCLDDQVERPVGAPVVDEDHLVRAAREGVEHRHEPPNELGEHRLLVVDGDRDRHAGLSHWPSGFL